MALTDENGGGIPATMLVGPTGFGGGYPVYQGGGNGGTGFGNDSGWWIILLFLLLLGNNGWGNNNGTNGGGNGGGLYPWMNQSNQLNDGFRDQMLNTTVNGIQQGINSLSTQLCNCCGDMQMALANGFAGVEQSANARQIADMQQNFAAQMANMQGFNGLTAQGADLKYTVATEACADRAALSEGIRDVMENCNRNNQAVLDKLCQLELDGVKGQLAQAQRENVGLQNQLNMAAMQASQTAQNAFIQQGFANEVDQLYNRLNSCPVPTTPVYGRTPIFTCGAQNMGCGCGCNG